MLLLGLLFNVSVITIEHLFKLKVDSVTDSFFRNKGDCDCIFYFQSTTRYMWVIT